MTSGEADASHREFRAMSSPPRLPSQWQRPCPTIAPPPRTQHIIDSAWVTAFDAVTPPLTAAPCKELRGRHDHTLRRVRSPSIGRWWRRISRRLLALQWVGRVQGIVYLVMAGWPLAHGSSFYRFTGLDDAAASTQCMAGILAAVGMMLLFVCLRAAPNRPAVWLGAGVATGFGFLDVGHLAMHKTSGVYWLDVLLEVSMAIWWVAAYSERHNNGYLSRALASRRPVRTLYH
jgi:hypothetical protein